MTTITVTPEQIQSCLHGTRPLFSAEQMQEVVADNKTNIPPVGEDFKVPRYIIDQNDNKVNIKIGPKLLLNGMRQPYHQGFPLGPGAGPDAEMVVFPIPILFDAPRPYFAWASMAGIDSNKLLYLSKTPGDISVLSGNGQTGSFVGPPMKTGETWYLMVRNQNYILRRGPGGNSCTSGNCNVSITAGI